MKTLLTSRTVSIPKGVTVSVASRKVTVKGPRGELSETFKHTPCAIEVLGKRSLRVDMWFANRKQLACLRTITAAIENMIVGVTQGFRYKLRLAYSHFPITVEEEGDVLQIRNFMGTRAPRVVRLHDGVSVAKSSDVKDQLELTGNDIHAVSKSAALLHDTCMVRNKDIRKFLDGVYVAEKGAIGKEKSLY